LAAKKSSKSAPAKSPPKKPAAKAVAKVMKKAAGKAAAKPAAKAPAKVVAKAPAKVVAKAPTKVVAKAPAKVVAKAPTKVVAKAPAKVVAKAPAKVVAKTPEKVVAKAPVKGAGKAAPVVAKKGAVVPVAKGAAAKALVPAVAQVLGKNGKAIIVPVTAKQTGKMPTVPEVIDLRMSRKGPIELGSHKSVTAMAVAVLQSRGDTSGYLIINGRRVRAISTKDIVLPKKPRGGSTAVVVPPTQSQIAEIKTKLTSAELKDYHERLLVKRKSLISMLNGLEDEALRSPGGNLSNMPVHMADSGSDVYEQEFNLGMAETERELLKEIDAALLRVGSKTYGVCQMTGKPITKARLDAKPWAKYSIEAERISEANTPRSS
jgi:DnaK suppressor protein